MSIIIVIGLLVNVFLYMIGKNDKWGEQSSDESYCCGQKQTSKEQNISRINASCDAVFVNFEGSRHGEFWLMVGYYRAIENCLEELFEELLNFSERKFVNTAVNA